MQARKRAFAKKSVREVISSGWAIKQIYSDPSSNSRIHQAGAICSLIVGKSGKSKN